MEPTTTGAAAAVITSTLEYVTAAELADTNSKHIDRRVCGNEYSENDMYPGGAPLFIRVRRAGDPDPQSPAIVRMTAAQCAGMPWTDIIARVYNNIELFTPELALECARNTWRVRNAHGMNCAENINDMSESIFGIRLAIHIPNHALILLYRLIHAHCHKKG